MIHRADSHGSFVVTQPAHALLSGEIARAWGNPLFGEIEPREEFIIAAALHDIGWLDWELAPTLNPETGWPHAFDRMPVELHLEIWQRGPRLASSLGLYVALLVSLHGTYLFEDNALRSQNHSDERQAFLQEQRALQAELAERLRLQPRFAPHVTSERLKANRAILRACDLLSLLVCMGVQDTRVVPRVPSPAGWVELRYQPLDGDATRVRLSPWPFREEELLLSFGAQQLTRRWSSEKIMRTELPSEPWRTMTAHLLAGG